MAAKKIDWFGKNVFKTKISSFIFPTGSSSPSASEINVVIK